MFDVAYVRKPWEAIKNLPVWQKTSGRLGLMWYNKYFVKSFAQQCSRCSIWFLGSAGSKIEGVCCVCADGDMKTLVNAAVVIREHLSTKVLVPKSEEGGKNADVS